MVGKGQLDSETGGKSHSGGTCVSLSDFVCLEGCRGTSEGGWGFLMDLSCTILDAPASGFALYMSFFIHSVIHGNHN